MGVFIPLAMKPLFNMELEKTNTLINLLELNRTIDEIAQARIRTQWYMNNAWSEMVSSTPCVAYYCSFSPW